MTESSEQAVVFACGEEQLIGILHRPTTGAPRREQIGVLVVVGGPQYRVGSHRQFVLLGRALAAAGYAVFRFDYRGMGDSDGSMRTFEQAGDDIRAALDAFARECPELQGFAIWGLCDAASAALMYCPGDARVRGLVLVNPWARSEATEARAYVRHYYGKRLLQKSFWVGLFTGKVQLFGSVRDFLFTLVRARKQSAQQPAASFLERMLEGAKRFRGPVLVVISEHDLTAAEFVELSGTPHWQAALGRPGVSTVRLAGADHTFSDRSALERANEQFRGWLTGAFK
jgi:exosortase A-associated hydrolase 1